MMGSSLVANVMDRLRPVVGMNGWEYCVLWKPSQDQSCFEWIGCCCAGVSAEDHNTISSHDGGGGGAEETQLFPLVSSTPSAPVAAGCRDFSFLHPRTKACDVLASVPSSMPLASSPGVHAEAFMSNQSKWIAVPSNCDEAVMSDETRVLVPIPGGLLVELFASKKVAEDENVVEFVVAATRDYCNSGSISMNACNRYDHVDEPVPPTLFLNYLAKNEHPSSDSQPWGVTPYASAVDSTVLPNGGSSFPWDLSLDASLLRQQRDQHMEGDQEGGGGDGGSFFEGSADSILCGGRPQQFLSGSSALTNPLGAGIDHHQADNEAAMHHVAAGMDAGYLMNNMAPDMVGEIGRATHGVVHGSAAESTVLSGGEMDVDQDKVSVKGTDKVSRGRVDCGSDGSNQGDDDDDQKTGEGNGGARSHQSKNLMAERRRRKKLNDRLLALRSLVPNITKMDRASILADAIDYVKKLDQQVKDLRAELEKATPEDEDHDHQEKRAAMGGAEPGKHVADINNQDPVELLMTQMGASHNDLVDHQDMNHLFPSVVSSKTTTANDHLPRQRSKSANQTTGQDNGQNQMEVQVEVFQVSRNEFFVKVFCEHKAGGFVRLMEAMNSLGLEVTNANVTTFRPLVLSVFKVEKRDNEVVEADQVRESLLELTRESHGEWQSPLDIDHELQQEVNASNQYQHQYSQQQQQQQQHLLHYFDHQ